MRRLTAGWRALLPAIVVLFGMAMGQGSVRAASDLVYEGQFDVGGTIRLTLSPDHSGVTSFSLEDVPFREHGGCGVGPTSRLAYFDPPVPVVNGAFAILVGYGDAHHPDPYAITGILQSNRRLEGVARLDGFLECPHPSDSLQWSADGPVTALPGTYQLMFVGPVAGGQITVLTSADRSQLTGAQLQNVQLPCISEALDLDVLFDPPLELRTPGDHFEGSVPAFLGPNAFRQYIGISATFARADVIGGTISGGNISTCDPNSLDVIWTANLVGESATPMPAPSPGPSLPSTGQSYESGVSAMGPAVLALFVIGFMFLLLGLRFRHR